MRSVRIEDRYLLPEGPVFLTGIQALVRVLLDQHRADVAGGLRTATLVSGYQGSPLAGFDKAVAGLGQTADAHDLVLRPAVNEELGATAVWGSQLAGSLPGPRYDGVVGVWYGKAPGVDRSADAIRHGNYVGTDPRGGVLALCGDDPACKSSSIPSASESLLAALQVPTLFPGSIQELLDLGRHAIACSRASGLWTAMKVVTSVADAAGTAEVGINRVTPLIPPAVGGDSPYEHRPSAHLLAPQSLEMERSIVEVRLELAKRYARLNRLNVVTGAASARLGLIAAGSTYHDLLQALDDLGVDPSAGPVRLLKIGMLFPLDEEILREFAVGLTEVLVIEEKGPFLERLVKEALYGMPDAPLVTGGRDDRGEMLLPRAGVLDPDVVARAVGLRLLTHHDFPSVRAHLDQLDAREAATQLVPGVQRTPYFCSGCPHNTSLVAPDDALVGAGIGCHTMVLLAPGRTGHVEGMTQMGAEGAQWIGVAPFIEDRHFVQNLGDGTFHHSGSLAVRAAVAAGLDVTYKLLYNDAVAMTGGQQIAGQLSVSELAASLAAEGVRRIIITTEDTSRYRDVELPRIADVRDRNQILAAQRELADVSGVTVLIHDQACAAELRRARKRGKAEEPAEQVFINERVCEGCGDCGEKSSCLSVEPVATEFGQKTRIDQASCNKDYSCLEGDCPSFVTVVPRRRDSQKAPSLPDADLPEPEPLVASDDIRVRLVGIGGTGVVTVSQILGMAALLEGRHAFGLDQTGLSQKAGPVVSDVRIASQEDGRGVNAPSGSVDLLLGFDILGSATARSLHAADPQRTIAVVATGIVPTGRMVSDPRGAPAPDAAAAVAAIEEETRSEDNVYLDARGISQLLFDDQMPANVILLGAAWQCGAIPLSRGALREAIRLNGAAVEHNLAAFEWGRSAVAAPELLEQLGSGPDPFAPISPPSPRERGLIDRITTADGTLRQLLELRVPDLVAWGNYQAAERYIEAIARVRAVEQERLPDSTQLTEAVVRGLHKLTAYKDEYEVARLHLDYARSVPRDASLKFHLHPPFLRALGMKRKVRLGRWALILFAALRAMRRLRGTVLDPFGKNAVRRTERALPAEYLAAVEHALRSLSPSTLPTAVEIAELPELVRGYEEIKLEGVAQFRARLAELTESDDRKPQPVR